MEKNRERRINRQGRRVCWEITKLQRHEWLMRCGERKRAKRGGLILALPVLGGRTPIGFGASPTAIHRLSRAHQTCSLMLDRDSDAIMREKATSMSCCGCERAQTGFENDLERGDFIYGRICAHAQTHSNGIFRNKIGCL
ncbi:hypothetical protein EVAR_19025_1 [Eumeta japonica]|uniref:Uncharacterized protein n=1 Tax=Eumeta variegata TaxID=151549 RepID=A0A4C1V9N0_EUMVA|nr:hypothetical protein EVAR_19025_1 [Eumeta japonica]